MNFLSAARIAGELGLAGGAIAGGAYAAKYSAELEGYEKNGYKKAGDLKGLVLNSYFMGKYLTQKQTITDDVLKKEIEEFIGCLFYYLSDSEPDCIYKIHEDSPLQVKVKAAGVNPGF